MAMIDISTDVGRCRLRCGDYSDIPFLSDEVYSDAIAQNNGNLQRASVLCAQYILAQLSFSGHRKLAQLEVWSNDVWNQYRQFLMLLIKEPALNAYAPIPYNGDNTDNNPLIQFTIDFNANYANGTQSQLLHEQANFSSGVL